MEKKIEKVHQFYTALAQGDFETVGALLSDDLVWHQPGKGTLSGIYSGKQNVFAHLGTMAQLGNVHSPSTKWITLRKTEIWSWLRLDLRCRQADIQWR